MSLGERRNVSETSVPLQSKAVTAIALGRTFLLLTFHAKRKEHQSTHSDPEMSDLPPHLQFSTFEEKCIKAQWKRSVEFLSGEY